MPNKKISQLDLASALDGSELVEIVQGGNNVQTTTQDIADLGGGGGGSSNDKADALITVDDSHGGNYTLAAAELTAINTGVTLILEGDTSGDLTVPANSTVAFPVGTVIGVRDFNNVVEAVGVSVTPTSGTLEITDGMTATLEKTGSNSWILHNGSAASGGGGGHEIKTAGTPLTQRSGLNFSSKFTVSDDSGNDETDVDINLDGKADSLITTTTKTASHTLDATDLASINAGDSLIVVMNVASANDLTIPLNATQAFPTGTIIGIRQKGAGQTTVVATGGVTLNAPLNAFKLAAQNSMAFLEKTGTNEWYLNGETVV